MNRKLQNLAEFLGDLLLDLYVDWLQFVYGPRHHLWKDGKIYVAYGPQEEEPCESKAAEAIASLILKLGNWFYFVGATISGLSLDEWHYERDLERKL